jgi:MraZ protein
VTRRTWLGLAAGVLVLVAGAAVACKLSNGSGATAGPPQRGTDAGTPAAAESPPAVVLKPPAPPPSEPEPPGGAPQASLLQPVPAEATSPAPAGSADPSGRITAARWPLPALVTEEAPPVEGPPEACAGRWCRPVPLEQPGPFAGITPVRSVPSLGSATRAKPPARAKARPLTGTHPCVLHDGNTLALPEGARRQLDDPKARELFAIPGPDQSLWLYTAAGLEKLAEQFDRSPQPAARVRGARRVSFAQAEPCPVDRAGRAALPGRLVEFAGLRHDAVLLGVGDHLELWDAQHWQDYLRRETNSREERGR